MANAAITTATTNNRTAFIEKLIDHLAFREHVTRLGIYSSEAEEEALRDMIKDCKASHSLKPVSRAS